MQENGQYPHHSSDANMNVVANISEENGTVERVSIEQLRHLVQLLDESDVSEIDIERADEGLHLVMRKASAQEGSLQGAVIYQEATIDTLEEDASEEVDTRHTLTAAFVGIFHSWSKPKGKALVAVGDHVKVGQRVGTLQSLNVMNEIETAFAGRVAEIFVQEGQAVEYGQQLMVIDSSEEA